MKRKKIIFLAPTLHGGGGERRIAEQTLNFPDNIEKIIVLFENKVSYPYRGKLISLNVPYSNNFFKKIYYFLLGLLKFRKIVRKEKPDYILSCGKQQEITSLLVRSRPIIMFGSSSESYKTFWGRVAKFLFRLLFLKHPIIFVAPSQAVKADIVKNFRLREDKIRVIHNPINTERVQKLAKEPLEKKHQEIFKNLVIINMGRLCIDKGQWHLIRAFKEVKKRKKDLKLVVLGEGELRGYLEKLIRELNLEKDVYLMGWQNNPFKYLIRSRLFVLSSFREAFPTVVLEAMACDLPIIATDCQGGLREILAPGTIFNKQADKIEYVQYGILIPPLDNRFYHNKTPLSKSEKLLSEAIIKVNEDGGLRDNLIRKSKERVKDFTPQKAVNRWLELISN
jgi:glycosyltransferase involved in cell wall biosynthesis